MGAKFTKTILPILSVILVTQSQSRDLSDLNLNLFSGPVTVVGPWIPDAEAISQAYQGQSVPRFGAYTVLNDEGNGIALDASGKAISPVRAMHYIVGEKNGEKLVGYRVLPLVNREMDEDTEEPSVYYPKSGQSADGQVVRGSETVDEQLSQRYYGQSYPKITAGQRTDREKSENLAQQLKVELEFPLTGILSYFHSEYHQGTFQTMASGKGYESQGIYGHMGTYLGLGHDLDAPEGLHGGIGVKGEPATLHSVRLLKRGSETEFESSRSVNLNYLLTARVLNREVSFSDDYMRDVMRGVNLRTILAIWRAWIDREWIYKDALTGRERSNREKAFFYKLRNDPFWKLYCAEFVTTAYNISMNVLQNEAYYKFLWPRDGASLFRKYSKLAVARLKDNYPGQDIKVEYVQVQDSAFETLLQSDVELMAQREANPNVDVMDLPLAKEWGRNLIWNPLKTYDLLAQYVGSFANWTRHGAAKSSLMALGTWPEVKDRMEIKFSTFKKVITPIVASIIAFEIAWKMEEALASPETWTATTQAFVAQLQQGFLGLASQNEDMLGGERVASWNELFAAISERLVASIAEEDKDSVRSKSLYRRARSLNRQIKNNDPNTSAEYAAYRYYQYAIDDYAELGRSTQTQGEGTEDRMLVVDYSPPKTAQAITQGMHKSHPRIVLTPEGIVMDASEVRKSASEITTFDPVQNN